ncbi:MAG: hypothetical protein Q8P33_00050 [bacterium]|nr:hypothetical protein [bacterium]
MKNFVLFLQFFVLSVIFVGPASADNIFKEARKRHQKMFRETADAVREAVVPPLVRVERGGGPRYYSDVVYYPRGDTRRRDDRHMIVIDNHHRPYCRTHRHYDEWRYRDLRYGTRGTYSGLHFVIRLGDRWYCDRHRSYGCDVLSSRYYSSYHDEREVIERSHDLWDSAGPRYVDTPNPAPPTFYFGTGGRKLSVDGGGTVICRIHNRTECAIVIGIVHGGTSYRYVGTRVHPTQGEHSAFCARGTHCE